MKKQILILIAFMLFFATVKTQPFTAEVPLNRFTADSNSLVTVASNDSWWYQID